MVNCLRQLLSQRTVAIWVLIFDFGLRILCIGNAKNGTIGLIIYTSHQQQSSRVSLYWKTLFRFFSFRSSRQCPTPGLSWQTLLSLSPPSCSADRLQGTQVYYSWGWLEVRDQELMGGSLGVESIFSTASRWLLLQSVRLLQPDQVSTSCCWCLDQAI